MITYMYHVSEGGLPRVEMREPIITTIGQKPDNQYQEVRLIDHMPMVSMEATMDMSSTFVMERLVFETVRFCTMKWVEEEDRGGMSMGYYQRIDTYSLIPSGMTIEGATKHEPGEDIYSYLNTTPLRRTCDGELRRRVDIIENNLADMSNRPILDRQDLEQIRQDLRHTSQAEMNIPRRLREFDFFENDNNFKVE